MLVRSLTPSFFPQVPIKVYNAAKTLYGYGLFSYMFSITSFITVTKTSVYGTIFLPSSSILSLAHNFSFSNYFNPTHLASKVTSASTLSFSKTSAKYLITFLSSSAFPAVKTSGINFFLIV